MSDANFNGVLIDGFEKCADPPIYPIDTSFISQYDYKKQLAFYFYNKDNVFMYDMEEDSWITLPSPNFTVGADDKSNCGCAITGLGDTTYYAYSGGVNFLCTDRFLKRDISGFTVELGGNDNFYSRTIIRNTIGPSSIIYLSGESINYSGGTEYILRTPMWFCKLGGIQQSGTCRVYDYATNEWNTYNLNLLASGINNNKVAQMASGLYDVIYHDIGYASPYRYDSMQICYSGIAASGDINTLYTGTKFYTTYSYFTYPFDIYITSGTGSGQKRTALLPTEPNSSIKNLAFIIDTSWSIIPDNTSAYIVTYSSNYFNISSKYYNIINSWWGNTIHLLNIKNNTYINPPSFYKVLPNSSNSYVSNYIEQYNIDKYSSSSSVPFGQYASLLTYDDSGYNYFPVTYLKYLNSINDLFLIYSLPLYNRNYTFLVKNISPYGYYVMNGNYDSNISNLNFSLFPRCSFVSKYNDINYVHVFASGNQHLRKKFL